MLRQMHRRLLLNCSSTQFQGLFCIVPLSTKVKTRRKKPELADKLQDHEPRKSTGPVDDLMTETNNNTIDEKLSSSPQGAPHILTPSLHVSNQIELPSFVKTATVIENSAFNEDDKSADGKRLPEKITEYDKHIVSLFHRPTQRVVNVNMNSDNELSVFVRHRGELIDVKLSEKFKRAVEEVQAEEEKKTEETVAVPKKKSMCMIKNVDESTPPDVSFSYKRMPVYYLRLAKIRLTGLVVSTAMAGYAIAPGAFDTSIFLQCSLGTFLLAASANAINQHLEVKYDSQMIRTKNRPVVTGQLSSRHALLFASATGSAGALMLMIGVNPLTAGLGVFNLALYTAVYTPMKRQSIYNTWVGAVVGAVPPLMGWAASTGGLQAGAWLLGAVMYAWQFPHFCALSWNLRSDYTRAGYRMMSVDAPELCKRVSLRYSLGIAALCTLAPYLDVTTWMFAIESVPVNGALSYLAWRFYRDGDSRSSRRLFHFSLIHLPLLMGLMIYNKSGQEDITSRQGEKLQTGLDSVTLRTSTVTAASLPNT